MLSKPKSAQIARAATILQMRMGAHLRASPATLVNLNMVMAPLCKVIKRMILLVFLLLLLALTVPLISYGLQSLVFLQVQDFHRTLTAS